MTPFAQCVRMISSAQASLTLIFSETFVLVDYSTGSRFMGSEMKFHAKPADAPNRPEKTSKTFHLLHYCEYQIMPFPLADLLETHTIEVSKQLFRIVPSGG